jgi:hypothetical protein
MTATTDLRFAPAAAAVTAFLEPHRPWLDSVLGCPLGEALTFEVQLPFGQLATESSPDGAVTLHPAMTRWTLPPGGAPGSHSSRRGTAT